MDPVREAERRRLVLLLVAAWLDPDPAERQRLAAEAVQLGKRIRAARDGREEFPAEPLEVVSR